MKNIFLFFLFGVSISGFSQLKTHQQNDYTFFSGDTSLNVRLASYFNANIKWSNYDTLCIASCMFVRFAAGNKKISSIEFSSDAPDFLTSIIEKGILSTAKYWTGRKNENYLLPFVFIFEYNCRPYDTGTGNVLCMLEGLSGNTKAYSLPGFADYTPVKCTILNSFLITTHY